MAETEPILKRVDDIPKKLDLILEQLTMLSGVEAKAPKIEKSNVRKQQSDKRRHDPSTKAFNAFAKVMEENNKLLEKQVEMANAAKKMQEKAAEREKKTAADINRKGREKAQPQLEKLKKMTLDQQMEYWQTKEKLEKQKSKIEKKILRMQKGNLAKRGGKKALEIGKGASGDILGELGGSANASNFLLALGPVGMIAKMLVDDTGLGKKAGSAIKKKIPTWLGGDKESQKSESKRQIESIKQQKALEKRLGGSKKQYVKQILGNQKGYKISDTGEISLDDDYLQKSAMKKKAPSSPAIPASQQKAVSTKKLKQQAIAMENPKRKGNPTDQQMKNSVSGRPFLWFWRKQKEESGTGKNGKVGTISSGKSGGLLDMVLPVLGALAGAAVGLVKGVWKGITGKGKPTTVTPKDQRGSKSPARKKAQAQQAPAPTKAAKTPKTPKTAPTPAPTAPKKAMSSAKPGMMSMLLSAGTTAAFGGSMEDMGKAALTAAGYQAGAAVAEKAVTKGVEIFSKFLGRQVSGSGVPVIGNLVAIALGIPDLIEMGKLVDEEDKAKREKYINGSTKDKNDAMRERPQWGSNYGATENWARENDREIERRKKEAAAKAKTDAFFSSTESLTLTTDATKSTQNRNTMRQGVASWNAALFQVSIDSLHGMSLGELATTGTFNSGGLPSANSNGLFSSQSWYRDMQANRRNFNLANDSVKEPKKADDLLSGPKGNYTFNPRDQHYALPDGQILSTNRGINTLPESKGIRDGRFSSTNNTGQTDNTEKLLQQILSALQNGQGNATVINNTTKLINPENFVTGGLFV